MTYFPQVLLLMPLRHTPTIERLQTVLTKIDLREAQESQNNELLLKFRRQTTRRIQVLQGKSAPGADGVYDILEFSPFEADESSLEKEKLYKTMDSYLKSRKAEIGSLECLGVSISGGVDSMVVARLLCRLSPKHGDYKVVGIHVDYANRAESQAESDFVRDWCRDEGILFKVYTMIRMYRPSSSSLPRFLFSICNYIAP